MSNKYFVNSLKEILPEVKEFISSCLQNNFEMEEHAKTFFCGLEHLTITIHKGFKDYESYLIFEVYNAESDEYEPFLYFTVSAEELKNFDFIDRIKTELEIKFQQIKDYYTDLLKEFE